MAVKREEILIAVVDGQGGGVGKSLVEKLKKTCPGVRVRALGTNAEATGRMLRAGADDGATGENAVMVNVSRAQVVLGVVGVLASGGLLGEITPAMARAIGESDALKILVPTERCRIRVTLSGGSLSAHLDDAAERAAAEVERLTTD